MVTGGMVIMIASVAASAVTSVAVSTAVSWLLGPKQRARETVRQEAARRTLELRLRLRKALKKVDLDLAKDELVRLNLERGGHATCRTILRDYERALLPVVQALDDPDLSRKLKAKLRMGMFDLLGSYRFEHLAICETEEDIKLSLEQFPLQPPQQRHLDAPSGLLPAMYRHTGASQPVVTARKRVKELIKLLA